MLLLKAEKSVGLEGRLLLQYVMRQVVAQCRVFLLNWGY